MKRKVLSCIIIFCLVVVCIPLTTTIASAKSYGVYNTLDVPPKYYSYLETGKISATKVNGVWCYKFSKGNNCIYVKCSGFKKNCTNSTSTINKNLTNAVNSRKNYTENGAVNYLYKRHKSEKVNGIIMHETFVKAFNVSEYCSNSMIVLQCTAGNSINFQYYEKVNVWDKWRYVTKAPSTAKQYMNALERYNYTDILKHNIDDSYAYAKPKFSITEKKAATKNTYISFYNLKGNGYSKYSSFNTSNNIKAVYSAVKGAGSVVTGSASGTVNNFKTSLKYIEKNYKGYKRSFNTKKRSFRDNKKCTQATYTSPVELLDKGQYIEINNYFAGNLQSGKYKSTFNVSFQICK